ncbi:kinase suppressor of Ras 2-like, partial [Paramuricea clavata]
TTVASTVQEQQPSNLGEIPLEKLDVNWKDPVGMGSFGKVFRGNWLCTDVAVKQIRRGASVSESIQRE